MVPDQLTHKPRRFGMRAVAKGLIVLAALMLLVYGCAFAGPWPDSRALDWVAAVSLIAFVPTGLLGIVLWIVAAIRRH